VEKKISDMQYTKEQIEAAVKAKNYKWFETGNYNLNIVGVRNSSTGDQITNKFDDLITVSYMIEGMWHFHQYAATTDPGRHWADNLVNPNGVAILVPGQYRGSHRIDLHQGKYKALKQKSPVKVYRDRDRDASYDKLEESVQEGLFGINIHRASASGTSTQIDKWSAGCQVIASNQDFVEFMELVTKSSSAWGNSFTYTLIESQDIHNLDLV
jgi:hypothetical protein